MNAVRTVGEVVPSDRRRRGVVYLVVALAGVCGALGLVLLREVIASIA